MLFYNTSRAPANPMASGLIFFVGYFCVNVMSSLLVFRRFETTSIWVSSTILYLYVLHFRSKFFNGFFRADALSIFDLIWYMSIYSLGYTIIISLLSNFWITKYFLNTWLTDLANLLIMRCVTDECFTAFPDN